ncbi:MAG: insulinase family protein [Gemmataceae bacterium]|nr:insulinase family protein [Gemmataceae bacterium]
MKLPCKRPGWILALFLAPLLNLAAPHVRLDAEQPAKEADDAVAKAAAALYEGIRTETLPNGLQVYIKRVPTSPVVTTMVCYKVGSCDEDKAFTGLSHYLEHLMFKGTDKLFPGDIDRLTLRSGGHNNAYTTEDVTNYHFDVANDQWEVPLRIEADRMRNIRIDERHEFEQEKGAVIAELNRNEDGPWDLEGKLILPLLFGTKAPYGHPVIGERQHVRAATADVIKAYYDKWYHPNNAAIVVVGDVDPDKVLAKIKELFGPIPMKKLPVRNTYTPIVRKGPVKKSMASKLFVPRLLIGYNTVKTGDPDYYPLEICQAILSGGKTSRLYKHMIEGAEVASAADASNSTGRYPGWFGIYVDMLKGKSLDNGEKLVLAELKKLCDTPVSDAELKRVKKQLFASTIFAREGVHSLADTIARGVTTNDLDTVKNYLTKINAVTPAEVQRVAKKYFDPEQRVVIYSEIKGEKDDKKDGGAESAPAPKAGNRKAQRSLVSQKEPMPGKGFSFEGAQKVVLPNGMTLLLLENRRLPIVVAQAHVANPRLHEPADKSGVGNLVGRLLDEGTTKHTGQEIAELIENTGGSLSLSSEGGSVKVLSPDRKLGLGLLFECLATPSFPKDAFNRQREQLLSEIGEAETQPDSRAVQEYRSLVYGKHPFARPPAGTKETVQKLTPEDCKAFHSKVFVPNNTTIAIVGDFDSKQVIEEIKALTADWKKTDLSQPMPAPAAAPEKFTTKIVTMPEAEQLHFYMGHPGIKRDNPDYYKLLVMDYVLGTGPGFTDRLSSAIRDRKGLAYTVRANITSSATDQPGLFTCYVGTEPQHFNTVKGMFLKELNRIRDEAPTKDEVEDAKKYLLGSMPFDYISNSQVASGLLGAERYGLGFDRVEKFRKAVAAVTPADVHEVAKKYLDPTRMVLVVVGAVDKEGKPLTKLPPPKQ